MELANGPLQLFSYPEMGRIILGGKAPSVRREGRRAAARSDRVPRAAAGVSRRKVNAEGVDRLYPTIVKSLKSYHFNELSVPLS